MNNIKIKSEPLKRIGWLSLFTAFSSSLCCIIPIFAILAAGTSGIASNYLWLESARPYFWSSTVLTLSLAWYQKLKVSGKELCHCNNETLSFWQSKRFLGIITILSILFLSFPNYAHIFLHKPDSHIIINEGVFKDKVELRISGMTCVACEHHVKTEIDKIKGVKKSEVSYSKSKAVVVFDKKRTSIKDIIRAINSTGYSVVSK
ncbi:MULTISPECIES: mercuric transport protein MerTP [unclassified Arcicella]|uniref:mercuric transport protein MerTP n=1 Tax=unclassified Arcicella TaxID=2644986 RepID=UPI00286227E5|nr:MULTISPECIES: mercuric transport protein MerTP [unclassified Arcicella]MDR6563825.1 copper chaperone CopZ [Arcicella sp. BE51]MDR6813491.1 copper chaperone CopZ [Arcicella sp. BE140]MDR6824804.1 copper chaperone CopZ [Arcicella sp. BE139]